MTRSLHELAESLNRATEDRDRLARELLQEHAGKPWQWIHRRKRALHLAEAEVKRLEKLLERK